LANVGADPDTEYFSDGITESLINSLAQLPRVRVKGRNSVFRYKGREMDAQAVGRELGVRAVLTGRVTQRGDWLVIGVELVDTRDNNQIWGEHFNRKLSDIVAVQQEISKEISEKLRLRLTGEEQKRLTKPSTQNTEAYQLYLKGRYHWNKRTADGLKKGIEYFSKAIEKDPRCASCYSGLADSYNALPGYSVVSPRDSFPQAKEAARQALMIDATLADAHTALAYALMYYDWNWPEAEREFKLAIELNPNYAFAHHWYAIYLQAMQHHDEAISEMKRALELDPLSLAINSAMSWVLSWAWRLDEAIEAGKNTVELDPSFVMGHVRLGRAYEYKQMYEEAVHELQKAVALTGRDSPMRLSQLAHVYGASGQRAEALELLNELNHLSTQNYVPAEHIAWVYTGLGDKDLAFVWWEKAYQERALKMPHLQSDPGFNDLRSDPRFAELVRRVGLPP
jgi:TolB-like protein/Flp pilus assembly protein TadD